MPGSFRKKNFQNGFTPYIDNTDENVTKCYFYILSFPERKNQGEVVLVISLPWQYVFHKISKYYFEK